MPGLMQLRDHEKKRDFANDNKDWDMRSGGRSLGMSSPPVAVVVERMCGFPPSRFSDARSSGGLSSYGNPSTRRYVHHAIITDIIRRRFHGPQCPDLGSFKSRGVAREWALELCLKLKLLQSKSCLFSDCNTILVSNVGRKTVPHMNLNSVEMLLNFCLFPHTAYCHNAKKS